MAFMMELLKEAQVGFWSTWEIREVLDAMLSEARRHRITYGGQVLKQQHLINALLLYVYSLDEKSRIEAFRWGIARMEGEIAPTDDPAPRPGRVTEYRGAAVIDMNEEPGARRRAAKKQGGKKGGTKKKP